MDLVATLIADPARDRLDADTLAGAGAALGAGADCAWLAPGVAADLFLAAEGPDGAGGACRALAERARAVLPGRAVDVIVQPAADRRKALFLADMDSTMIGQECIDELADYVGLKREVAAITEAAMRGEIAFEPALRQRVALLAGLPVTVVEEIIATRITLTPGARTLIATMRANGTHTCLVSGGFTLFTGPLSRAMGFDEHRANTLIVADGRLTGQVGEPILGREAKRETLVSLRAALSLADSQTLAIGDGANDLGMVEIAGLGVAFRAKPAVAARAMARIDHTDLTSVLYAQGYARSAFVTP